MSTIPDQNSVKQFVDQLYNSTQAIETELKGFNDRQIESTNKIQQDLQALETSLTDVKQTIKTEFQLINNERIEFLRKIEQRFQTLETELTDVLPRVRNELDGINTTNKNLHKLFEERLDGIKEDVKGIRQSDISNLNLLFNQRLDVINSSLKNLPTIKEIHENFTNENSPIATKTHLDDMKTRVSKIEGALSVNFWMITANILSVIIGIFVIYTHLQSLKYQQPTSIPSPQQKAP